MITISEEVMQSLEDISNVDISNYDLNDLSFSDIYMDILCSIKQSITFPIELITSLLACILITALMRSFSDATKHQKIYNIVCVLICIKIVVQPISYAILEVKDTMLNSSMFISSYIPILSGMLVTTGMLGTSATYSMITYFACQLWIVFANSIVLPLMSISLAISCVNSICPEVSLSEAIKSIKQCVHWSMSVAMFIFSGVMSIQTAISNASDKVSAKALKFVVSNGVPIVGSAVSDICGTIKSSLILLKSGVGLIGIVVLLINVLPPIVNVGIVRLIITLCETLCTMFDLKSIKGFLSDVSAVLSALFSCAVCFAITFIVSTGAIILLVS